MFFQEEGQGLASGPPALQTQAQGDLHAFTKQYQGSPPALGVSPIPPASRAQSRVSWAWCPLP